MRLPAMDLHWYSENTSKTPLKGGVILLPGRGNFGYNLLRRYSEVFDWRGVALYSITPRLDVGWYPPPKHPLDQSEAVSGLNRSNQTIKKIIDRVTHETGLPRKKLVIAGFSMGAVAAVYWAMNARQQDAVGAVVCHSGAVLEPWKVPNARHDMPIVLNHGADDYCFDWEERYLPMKRSLVSKGYNCLFAEREKGDHWVHKGDVSCLQGVFEDLFGTSLAWEPLWSVA